MKNKNAPALPASQPSSALNIATASPVLRISWKGRGQAPAGYIKGMAVTFEKVCRDFKAGGPAVLAMTTPLGSPNQDALAWYDLGEDDRPTTLRKLFTLLIGLGMRESSGRYCEGRDRSAKNVSGDTAEAGLFQQSWNSRTASSELPKLFAAYRAASDDGFYSIFAKGVTPHAGDLDNAGSGDGAVFQALCKSKPAFAVEAAAIGLRTIRQHWGPINRREAEYRPDVNVMLLQVQQAIEGK